MRWRIRHVLQAAGTALLILLSINLTHAEDLDPLLGRTTTPGSLALLLPHARNVRAQERWIGALAHRDPLVRAAAARLLHVVGSRGAAIALTRALQQETDERPAIEQALALLSLAGRAADGVVLDAAERFDGRPFARGLAGARTSTAVEHLDRIQSLELDLGTWSEVLPSVVAGRQDALEHAVRLALERDDPGLWESALELTRTEPKLSIDPAHLAAAATSPSPAIRELAWWQMAIHAVERKPLPDIDSLRRSSDTAGSTPEMGFGRELVSRALNNAATEQRAVIEREQKRPDDFSLPPFAREALNGPLHGLMTKAERRAFKVPEQAPPLLGPEPLRIPVERRPYETMRTVSDLPDGFAPSVLAETGCTRRKSDAAAVMGISHPKDGGVPELKLMAAELDEACTGAARLILMAGLVPMRAAQAGQLDFLLLPMHETFLDCLSLQGTAPPSAPVKMANGRIEPPRKVRHVAPVYPPLARDSRRQGIAIIESTISVHGCVSQAEVSRSAGIDFDVSAVTAVTGWKFTPTLLNGKPVPVIMTVTVQFRLE